MDSWNTIIVEKMDVAEPAFSNDELQIIESFIRVDQALRNLEQLNQIFEYNVKALSDNYKLHYDDTVYELKTGKEADTIAINALFINIVSAGKILMDQIQSFLGNDMESDNRDKFKKVYNPYDNVFAYRFFWLMRNFSHHSGMPISRLYDGRFCFDFLQIINAERFSIRNDMKAEMKRIIQEIMDKYQVVPNICFTQNVDDYVKAIYELYYRFLIFIESFVIQISNKERAVIENHPDAISTDPDLKGMVIYKIIDGNAHCFPVDADLSFIYQKYRIDSEKRFAEYEQKYHENNIAG